MRTISTALLCEKQIMPDGCVLVIEDVGAKGNSGVYVHADRDCRVAAAADALWVHTMSDHECDVVGRPVLVRVFSGADNCRLGVRAFDGELNVASGVFALGHRHNSGRLMLLGPPSLVRVTVYLGYDIDAITFDGSDSEYPLSGPSEVNVLLHGESGFVPVGSRPGFSADAGVASRHR